MHEPQHNTTQLTLSHTTLTTFSSPKILIILPLLLLFPFRFLTTSLLSCHLIPPFSLFYFFIFFQVYFPTTMASFSFLFLSIFFFSLMFLSFWSLFFFTSFFPPWCVMRFLVMGILSWLLKSLKTWSFSCWLFWVSSIFFSMCYLVCVSVRSNGSVFAVTVPLPRKVVGWWGWLQPREKDLAHVRAFCFQNWIPYNVVGVLLRKTRILSTLFSKKSFFFSLKIVFTFQFWRGWWYFWLWSNWIADLSNCLPTLFWTGWNCIMINVSLHLCVCLWKFFYMKHRITFSALLKSQSRMIC